MKDDTEAVIDGPTKGSFLRCLSLNFAIITGKEVANESRDKGKILLAHDDDFPFITMGELTSLAD